MSEKQTTEDTNKNLNSSLKNYDPMFISAFLNQARRMDLNEMDLINILEEKMNAPSIWKKIKCGLKKAFPFLVVGGVSGTAGFMIAKHVYSGDVVIHHMGYVDDDNDELVM